MKSKKNTDAFYTEDQGTDRKKRIPRFNKQPSCKKNKNKKKEKRKDQSKKCDEPPCLRIQIRNQASQQKKKNDQSVSDNNDPLGEETEFAGHYAI